MRAEGDITTAVEAERSGRPEQRMRGPFILAGPLDRGALGDLPVRGDLAHIAFAGRFFVPHYAVPQPRAVMPGGASLHIAPDGRSQILSHLLEGDSFEVLEVTGEWAWGCLTIEGPAGYVHVDRLESLP